MVAALFASMLLADPSAELFPGTGRLPVLAIEVKPEGVASLLKEPHTTVRAMLTVNGTTYPDIGLHLKGQTTGSFKPWNEKPGLTLNMDKYKKGQAFHGLDKFHLNNSFEDPSYLNPLVCGMLFRAAGVPAARAVPVRVELNGRAIGVSVLLEGFDKPFLKQYFNDTGGVLYDGGQFKDVNDDLEILRGQDPGRKDLKALAAALNIKDHAERLKAIDERLDLAKFYALWCIDVMCCGRDGYPRSKNNFRLYRDPQSKKFVMFAHGKDEMFEDPRDGLVHGWNGNLARSLYETEAGKRRYREELTAIFQKHFKRDEILKLIDSQSERIAASFENGKEQASYLKTAAEYRKRIEQRLDYLAAELTPRK